jgi:hypothetical protein
MGGRGETKRVIMTRLNAKEQTAGTTRRAVQREIVGLGFIFATLTQLPMMILIYI